MCREGFGEASEEERETGSLYCIEGDPEARATCQIIVQPSTISAGDLSAALAP